MSPDPKEVVPPAVFEGLLHGGITHETNPDPEGRGPVHCHLILRNIETDLNVNHDGFNQFDLVYQMHQHVKCHGRRLRFRLEIMLDEAE